jgi:cytochrome P450
MTLDFDPLASAAEDPYPVYRRLRDEAPVHYHAGRSIYSVTRYDDVMEVLQAPERFSSRAMFTMLMAGGSEKMPAPSWGFLRLLAMMIWKARLNPLEFTTARNLIAEDGASHAAMRAIVSRGFTPRRVASLEKRARELTEGCVAPLWSGASLELVHDLAVPLPVTIIAEMIGVPGDRLGDFKRWSDIIIDLLTGPGRERRFEKQNSVFLTDLLGYVRRLVRERRAHPTDDLISTIVAEQEGEIGLTDREVIQFVLLLLVAGNVTTTNLIGNVVGALLDHPEEAAKVAADPALVPALVEEGLRYDSPVQVIFRTATGETELRGVRIPKGAIVAVFLGSANRDERRFPDPDRLDVSRHPQGFPGFGFGKHFCLGASLARLETRIALESLAPLLPQLERVEARVPRVDSFLVRGPKRLELRRVS